MRLDSDAATHLRTLAAPPAEPHQPSEARGEVLVAELQSHDEFRALWDRHDVRPTRDEIKRFDRPDAGRLTLRRQTLTIAGAEDQVIIVYQPEAGDPSAVSCVPARA